jgi:hypothetical protein
VGEVISFRGTEKPSPASLLDQLAELHALRASGQTSDESMGLTVESRKTCADDRIVMLIEKVRELVRIGKITQCVFVGRGPENRHFLTEIVLAPESETEIFGFVGVLETLKLELTERALLAPALLPDGSLLDPGQKEGRT